MISILEVQYFDLAGKNGCVNGNHTNLKKMLRSVLLGRKRNFEIQLSHQSSSSIGAIDHPIYDNKKHYRNRKKNQSQKRCNTFIR